MTPPLLDRAITSLRAHHDDLATLVPTLTDEQLVGPSGASEWTLAQVLSHLGSGAEISRRPIAVAAGLDVTAEDNQAVWARWDGSTPQEQAAAYVEHDRAYIETVESLTDEQKAGLSIDLGFLPAPVPLSVAIGMRLNEVANHVWDVKVAVDPAARIDAEAAAILVELFAGDLSFLLGFSAKADQLDGSVTVAFPGGGLAIADSVTVTTGPVVAAATFDGPQEAVVRLLSGRLRPPYDAGVGVTGDVSLDDLRKVFPGY
ncbi:maleylpyruvate isomerase family mycothiol-dependent enzyme [Nocardioides sp. W7]|uniref:maleylpyruvate isomerase family mycothiol-dependent enzyme n=1 Tax=Nocardioides sp. W7 TaxID=2931390 RepID=UPI001FD3EBE8|nr:maleylpyruvate isomerase family mycothiol-dependent enzyme [Nocardioides sp. W7]